MFIPENSFLYFPHNELWVLIGLFFVFLWLVFILVERVGDPSYDFHEQYHELTDQDIKSGLIALGVAVLIFCVGFYALCVFVIWRGIAFLVNKR